MPGVLRCGLLGLLILAPLLAAPPVTLYVAPNGNDAWSGRRAEVDAQHRDGPFASLERATEAVRALRAKALATPVTVRVRGGQYQLTQPWRLGPEDGGTADAPVTYVAAEGETPVLSGGRRITGWKPAGGGLWTVDLPQVKAGAWTFRELWVNGRLRRRPRLPKTGWYPLAGSATDGAWDTPENRRGFRYREGELQAGWANRSDVEVVVLQYWTEARLRIEALDEAAHRVTFTGPSWRPLNWSKGYFVENVREALDAPGQWYLDGRTGQLTYWPLPGEDLATAEVIAPVLPQLARLEGQPGRPVRFVTLSGLTFAHTGAPWPAAGHGYPQAEIGPPTELSPCGPAAALYAQYAEGCRFERTTWTHLGQWALELGRGCRDVAVHGSTFSDLGGGAVRIGEPTDPADADATSRIQVVANRIGDGNRVYLGAPAVWVGHSGHNRIAHNELQGPWEWAISVGWNWALLPASHCRDNVIEQNLIHDLGESELGTHAAIYTLGFQPGTVIRGNLVHHVSGDGYGLVLDEGSTGILVEDNVFHHTDGGWSSNMHCIGNLVVNNIFALTRQAAMHRYGDPPPEGQPLANVNAATRNLYYWREGRLEQRDDWLDFHVIQDHNLYWDASGKPVRFLKYTPEEWRAKGIDQHSVLADPGFADPEHGDFTLAADSPALKVGFRPIDLSRVGPAGER